MTEGEATGGAGRGSWVGSSVSGCMRRRDRPARSFTESAARIGRHRNCRMCAYRSMRCRTAGTATRAAASRWMGAARIRGARTAATCERCWCGRRRGTWRAPGGARRAGVCLRIRGIRRLPAGIGVNGIRKACRAAAGRRRALVARREARRLENRGHDLAAGESVPAVARALRCGLATVQRARSVG